MRSIERSPGANSRPMSTKTNYQALAQRAISQPLVSHIYTADPSAHVFNGKLYIYPSHDIDAGIPFNDNGDHFGMEDYHVLSVDENTLEATDHGVALHVKDVPWASRQMWAPDAAEKNGKYYFYFPARDHEQMFRIGVAVGESPVGPFKAEPNYMKGSYSIDPAVFKDDDGSYYMYVGGIWGGQLQQYRDHNWAATNELPAKKEAALRPYVAKLTEDMLEFAEPVRYVDILDEHGELCWKAITIVASSKPAGCISTRANTTSVIRQETPTTSATPSETVPMVPLPMQGVSSSL